MSLCGGKLLLLKDEEVVELIDAVVAARWAEGLVIVWWRG